MLLRSILFMPSSKPSVLSKSLALTHCDGFIFDLEDAVSPLDKQIARSCLDDHLMNVSNNTAYANANANTNGNVNSIEANVKNKKSDGTMNYYSPNQQLVVRINGYSSPFYDEDIKFVKELRNKIRYGKFHQQSNPLHNLQWLLPKVESADDIKRFKTQCGFENESVWAMIETPKGVLNAPSIGTEATCLVFGQVDLQNEIRCSKSQAGRWNIMTSIQLCLLAARMNGIPALDGVYVNLKDDEGFKLECEQGKALGFDGKTLVHPKSISDCNKIFSPSEDEVKHARRVMDAYEIGSKEKGGAILLDGKLVEDLHVRDARRILNLNSVINYKAS